MFHYKVHTYTKHFLQNVSQCYTNIHSDFCELHAN